MFYKQKKEGIKINFHENFSYFQELFLRVLNNFFCILIFLIETCFNESRSICIAEKKWYVNAAGLNRDYLNQLGLIESNGSGYVLVVRFDEILFNRKPDAESDIKFLSLSLSRRMAPLHSSAIVAIISFNLRYFNKKNHFIILSYSCY